MSNWAVKGRQVTITDDQGSMITNMTPIVITDVRIPFWRLVFILIKYTLAFIVAMILLCILVMVIGGAIYAVLSLLGIHAPMPHLPTPPMPSQG